MGCLFVANYGGVCGPHWNYTPVLQWNKVANFGDKSTFLRGKKFQMKYRYIKRKAVCLLCLCGQILKFTFPRMIFFLFWYYSLMLEIQSPKLYHFYAANMSLLSFFFLCGPQNPLLEITQKCGKNSFLPLFFFLHIQKPCRVTYLILKKAILHVLRMV